MTRHTPGPWTANFAGSISYPKLICIVDQDSDPIGYVGGNWKDKETDKTNARLIAAAPDMYLALSFMVETFDHCGLRGLIFNSAKNHPEDGWTEQAIKNQVDTIAAARAVLRAARGRQIPGIDIPKQRKATE